MYASKKELLKIMKDNEIRGYVNNKKAEIINTLKSKGLISDEINENEKNRDRYKFLRNDIRHNRRAVKVRNLETGDVTTYSSIYSCAKAFKVNAGTICSRNNKVLNDNLEIQIGERE